MHTSALFFFFKQKPFHLYTENLLEMVKGFKHNYACFPHTMMLVAIMYV